MLLIHVHKKENSMEDNINTELAKGVAQEAVKEIKEERSFAMELLADYKLITKRLYHIIVGLIITIGIIVVSFLLYLNQYDYVSYDQDGSGYNNVNTEIQGSVHNNNGAAYESPQEEK